MCIFPDDGNFVMTVDRMGYPKFIDKSKQRQRDIKWIAQCMYARGVSSIVATMAVAAKKEKEKLPTNMLHSVQHFPVDPLSLSVPVPVDVRVTSRSLWRPTTVSKIARTMLTVSRVVHDEEWELHV